MDAAKALTLAALAALFAAGFLPAAGAQQIGSPYVPDVLYDYNTHAVQGSPIYYQDTRNLGVTSLPSTPTVLYLCDAALLTYKSSVVNTQSHEVDFTSITFRNAGTWTVRDTCSQNATSYANFIVNPRQWYEVDVAFPQLYAPSMTWSQSSEYMTVNVVDLMNNRAPVPNANVVLYQGTKAQRSVTTDANGFWDTQEPLPGAGTFTIAAYKDVGGGPTYDVFGKTTLNILSAPLVVTRESDPPLANYTTPVTFAVAVNTTAPQLLSSPGVANYTLTLRAPNGARSVLTGTGAASSGPLAVLSNGNVVVTTQWTPGPYALTLNATAASTITPGPDWSQTWSVAADVGSAHDLTVAVTPKVALAGQPTSLAVHVLENGAPYSADVYLLSTAEATAFQAGSFSLSSVPSNRFAPAAQSSGPGTYVFNVALPLAQGPFVLLAREAGTPRHDNAGSEPVVAVAPATVTFFPGHLAFALQHQVPVSVSVVDANGKPVSGTLVLDSILSNGGINGNTTALSIPVSNGAASFVADPTAKGNLLFDFAPTGTALPPQRSTGVLYVERPNIAVNPSAIGLGHETDVSIQIRDLSGVPMRGLVVTLCGTPLAGCAPAVTTDANGTAIVVGAPIIAGLLAVRVNGADTGEVVSASSSINPLIVLGDPIVQQSRVLTGQSFTVLVPVTNKGQAAGLATLVLTANGVQVAQQTVQVPANKTVSVALSAQIASPGTYSVSVASGAATRGAMTVDVLAGQGAPVSPTLTPAPSASLMVLGMMGAALIGSWTVRRR
jgi:hypothetical protein